MTTLTRPGWLVAGAGVLLLAAALWRPWEFFSCCHCGFSLEPSSVGPAGTWLLGFAPEPRGGYPVRLATEDYLWRVALAAGVFVLAALRAAQRRALG